MIFYLSLLLGQELQDEYKSTNIEMTIYGCWTSYKYLKLRKAIFNWREPKSSFNFKLGSFVAEPSLFIENIQPLLDLITLPLFVILAKKGCPCLNIQDFLRNSLHNTVGRMRVKGKNILF